LGCEILEGRGLSKIKHAKSFLAKLKFSEFGFFFLNSGISHARIKNK